jgi:hypothetical protein
MGISAYDIISHRTYSFDDNGVYHESKRGAVGIWEIDVAEREILIPEITISHTHARSNGFGVNKTYLSSVDTLCVCGVKFPLTILDDIYRINKMKHKHCYAAIERGSYYRLDMLKKLAEDWFLDENKKQKEPALFHVCNQNHPGYLYYGKGIPISQIAMPPSEDKCKTCKLDIPKGIRLALLIMSKGIKLK